MSILSATQIARLVVAAGPASTQARTTAVSVALAESGGNTSARGRNTDGSIDRGLWQINSKWHPEVSDAAADNPTTATAAAYRISGGFTQWNQWASAGNGAAGRHRVEATGAVSAAATASPASAAASTAGAAAGGVLRTLPSVLRTDPVQATGATAINAGAGVLGGLDAVGAFFASLASRATWVRIAQVIGGATLALVGLLILGRDVLGTAAGAAADFVPGAGAVKTAGKIVGAAA